MEAVRTTITIEKALLYRVREDAKANRRDLSAEVCQLIDEAHKARDAAGSRTCPPTP